MRGNRKVLNTHINDLIDVDTRYNEENPWSPRSTSKNTAEAENNDLFILLDEGIEDFKHDIVFT